MSTEEPIERRDGRWKGRTLLAGGVIGAISGMGIAYLLIQRADRQGGQMSLSTGEGLRLGLLVLGMLRQIADLASPDEED